MNRKEQRAHIQILRKITNTRRRAPSPIQRKKIINEIISSEKTIELNPHAKRRHKQNQNQNVTTVLLVAIDLSIVQLKEREFFAGDAEWTV